MNYKYRQTAVIEAFQMTEARRWDNSEWPEWLHEAWNRGAGEDGLWPDPDDGDRLMLGTREGVQRLPWNDFIVRGAHGELYNCDPKIFIGKYEAVMSKVAKVDEPDGAQFAPVEILPVTPNTAAASLHHRHGIGVACVACEIVRLRAGLDDAHREGFGNPSTETEE